MNKKKDADKKFSLKQYIKQADDLEKLANRCPECFSLNVVVEGNCFTCLDCGWSKCDL